jgi:hypothetical protein
VTWVILEAKSVSFTSLSLSTVQITSSKLQL